MAEPIRWGILGASNFARVQMGPAIHAASGAELAALATSDPAKAEGFSAFAPRLRVHDSYDALLADPGIDAVYVPLPNTLHVDWTVKALDAGKHVLCEKPLGLKADDFAAVIAKRDETGLVAAEAFMIVHHPQMQRARELVQGGAIGRLRHVDAAFCFDVRARPDNIRNRPETGGGALPDVGVYVIGATRFVTGAEPESITHAAIERAHGVDVHVAFSAQFPDFDYAGLVSTATWARQDLVFHGEEGLLRLTNPYTAQVVGLAELVLDAERGRRVIESFPGINQYVLQVEAFGRSVRDGTPYACPLEFSRGTQSMIDMVYAAEGRGS